jgi:hypothetical protein
MNIKKHTQFNNINLFVAVLRWSCDYLRFWNGFLFCVFGYLLDFFDGFLLDYWKFQVRWV